MKRILLDTNVILDAMLQRSPWCVEADAILQMGTHGTVTCFAGPTSLATVFYVARKAVGSIKARAVISKCLSGFEIALMDKQTFLDADNLPGSDFEDNILIAAAVTASLDGVVTRNKAHFLYSPIPVWEPAELLQMLAGGGASPKIP
jgi:predicted nucleic acid-binding protein